MAKIDRIVPKICSQIHTYTQTDRQTGRNTLHPYRGGVIGTIMLYQTQVYPMQTVDDVIRQQTNQNLNQNFYPSKIRFLFPVSSATKYKVRLLKFNYNVILCLSHTPVPGKEKSNTHTQLFNGLSSRTTRVGRYQKEQEAQLSLRDRASALSVEIWQNTAQMFDGLHLKRPTTGE